MTNLILIRDKFTKESRGFGYVDFETKEQLDQCLMATHYLDDRKFDCKATIPIEFSSIRESQENEKRLFVGGLRAEWTDKELREYFSKFGSIETCYIAKKKDSELSRKFGFVFFNSPSTVEKVIKAEHCINGTDIFVRQLKPRKPKTVQNERNNKNFNRKNSKRKNNNFQNKDKKDGKSLRSEEMSYKEDKNSNTKGNSDKGMKQANNNAVKKVSNDNVMSEKNIYNKDISDKELENASTNNTTTKASNNNSNNNSNDSAPLDEQQQAVKNGVTKQHIINKKASQSADIYMKKDHSPIRNQSVSKSNKTHSVKSKENEYNTNSMYTTNSENSQESFDPQQYEIIYVDDYYMNDPHQQYQYYQNGNNSFVPNTYSNQYYEKYQGYYNQNYYQPQHQQFSQQPIHNQSHNLQKSHQPQYHPPQTHQNMSSQYQQNKPVYQQQGSLHKSHQQMYQQSQ